MDTKTAKAVLDMIKTRVAYYENDPAVRHMYMEALDTASDSIDNYERLIDQVLEENKQKLICALHECDMNILRYRLFTEGGKFDEKQ